MVERFNGRIGSEVLNINIYSHCALEQVLRGYNVAYNTRRQRVLAGKTPNQVVREQLVSIVLNPQIKPNSQAGPCDTTKARLIVQTAKEVSQPDKSKVHSNCLGVNLANQCST